MIALRSSRIVSSDDLDQLIETWQQENLTIQSSKTGTSLTVFDSTGKIRMSANILDTGLVDLKEWY